MIEVVPLSIRLPWSAWSWKLGRIGLALDVVLVDHARHQPQHEGDHAVNKTPKRKPGPMKQATLIPGIPCRTEKPKKPRRISFL